MSESIKRRIAALRQMTTARGCTEQEALAAAEKAAALMREYGLSELDIEISQQSVKAKTHGASIRDRLWRRLALCTNTATIVGDVDGHHRTFIGRAPGPEIATYLFVVLDRSIDRAIREFKKTPDYTRRRSRKTKRQVVYDFTAGMVARLIYRLDELFADAFSADALMDADRALVERYPGAGIVNAKSQGAVKNGNIASLGYLAGNNVNLSHGVNGSAVPKAIAGKAGCL
ncbi:DUF7168 domain-containing protein [Martelella mediterranea]|uniref:Uncharacterized protein DUF2786 n=1 Tax=Martelella mediterranea TaxID=293089 RepID=A0A4R3NRG3_9HYPH|nr:DUF2786 domain-containing protein [Martelella mediterranea]TCT37677.1 uncharacterized protein DUF2786 [Martelella mediterranea]